jgi:molybdopterin biosynthesis enzyme MoaB
LVDDGRGNPQGIALTGIGTEAKVAFSPATITFGVQTVGSTSSTQTVTIRNDGTAPLVINTLATTAGFSIAADSCPRAPSTIPVQGTCNVDVVFTPGGTGPAVGDLRVTYEPGGKVAAMRLEGTGN